MTGKERIIEINALLTGFHGWALFEAEITRRINELTMQLVYQNNEETRGRIKALAELKELPVSLQFERDGIGAALSEQDAAI